MKPHHLDLTELSCDSEQTKEMKAVPGSNGVLSRIAEPSSGILK